MKTADGVEFIEGMRLFLDDGEELTNYRVDGDWISYDWACDVDESGPAETITSRAHISSLHASLEYLKAFHTSKQHECMCCGVMLRQCHGSSHGDLETIPAHVGLVFRATGNYGSRLFDPMDSQGLQCYICDDCVEARAERVTHFPADGSPGVQWKL
jgi:hypothetical protein